MLQLSNVYGTRCHTPIITSPFIINCDYPSGFVMLQHIYQDIKFANNTAMIADNVSEVIIVHLENSQGLSFSCWSLTNQNSLPGSPAWPPWIPLAMCMSQPNAKRDQVGASKSVGELPSLSVSFSLQTAHCFPRMSARKVWLYIGLLYIASINNLSQRISGRCVCSPCWL